MIVILGFQPPEKQNSKFVLLEATKFVVSGKEQISQDGVARLSRPEASRSRPSFCK